MRPKVGSPNASQYRGTLKDTICQNCLKSLNHLDRIQQDEHAKKCKPQTKLI